MEKRNKGKKLLKKLRHRYRLVLMNNETFEEIGSYRLTMLNFYLLVSTVVVIVATIAVLVIFFTPLRRYLPGYGDVAEKRELQTLHRQVEEMEAELRAQRAYTENVRRILVGDVETAEDVENRSPQLADTAIREVLPSETDQHLRREVELEEVSQAARTTRAAAMPGRELPLEQIYFGTPVNGDISAGFMPDRNHYGVDVLAPKNTPIQAIMDGYVIFSDWTLETGNTIGIQHSNNIISIYKHNSTLLKEVGDYVNSGEAVAIIGNTGTLSDGPHLHFELWYKGKPVNPTEYINF
ncbi:MAG: M23 family metallopeptidase [Saprospiraceae bacterium]|nr:M23 family metallopeptidase [Saprospiraceae bacterium]